MGITCLLGILALEVAVRVFDLQSDNFTQDDRYTGWTHIPGRSGTYLSAEAKNEVEFNSLGFVGPETAQPKPPEEKRLLLVGDSFTESSQVPWETNWGSRVGDLLGDPWHVVNAGVSGYGTSHVALFLESRGWELNPDAVFLLFFTGNDVSDNSRALGRTLGWQEQPYFELRGESPGSRSLVLKNYPLPEFEQSVPKRVKGWLKNHSLLYLFARERVHRLTALRRQTAGEASVPYSWHVYKKGADKDWAEAWELTDQLIGRIAGDCRNRNVPFGVGVLPTGWRIDSEMTAALLEDYPEMADSTVWDFDLPDRRLIEILERRDIPYVHLTPVLKRAAKSDTRLYGDHLTDYGHEVVAAAIAKFWKEQWKAGAHSSR